MEYCCSRLALLLSLFGLQEVLPALQEKQIPVATHHLHHLSYNPLVNHLPCPWLLLPNIVHLVHRSRFNLDSKPAQGSIHVNQFYVLA
jgi:hypothetical protein